MTRLLAIAALVLTLCAPLSAGPRLQLRVRPQVAIDPASISIMAFRTPAADDRAWIISLLRDGDDIADRTSEVSVEGLDGDTLKRLTWEGIAEGSYTVLSCVRPALVCATAPLVVRGLPQ